MRKGVLTEGQGCGGPSSYKKRYKGGGGGAKFNEIMKDMMKYTMHY